MLFKKWLNVCELVEIVNPMFEPAPVQVSADLGNKRLTETDVYSLHLFKSRSERKHLILH